MTPRTNGPSTKADAVASAVTPSSQVADTAMLVLPIPRMSPALIASSPAAAMVAMVSVDDLPMKMSVPSRAMVHSTFVAGPSPEFMIEDLMPNPPVIAPISRTGCGGMIVTVAVSFTMVEFASVTVKVAVYSPASV